MYTMSRIILCSVFLIMIGMFAHLICAVPWLLILSGIYLFRIYVRERGMELWGLGKASWATASDLRKAQMIKEGQ